jgi:hypothetical protein
MPVVPRLNNQQRHPHEILLHFGGSAAGWRHLDTGDIRCSLTAEAVHDVA